MIDLIISLTNTDNFIIYSYEPQILHVIDYNKNVYITRSYSNIYTYQQIIPTLKECLERARNENFCLIADPDMIHILLSKYIHLINSVHIYKYTEIVKYYLDDKLQYDFTHEWTLNKEIVINDMIVYTHLVYRPNGECQYLKLLSDLNSSEERTGRNGLTKSIFAPDILRFNIITGYPLLTTKKMFFRGIVEELLFFIRGDTNSKLLEINNINIWKQNTSREFLDSLNMKDRKEGMMGPMYGFQWRNFNGLYDEKTGKGIGGIDQLQNLITGIKNDPHSRRHLLTDYNPSMANQGVLYPCHSISMQFYVQDEFIDLICFNRSSDVFLGLPFNIASTSLLLIIIAKLTGLVPRYVNISLGDSHIYEQHIKHIETQVNRRPFEFPTLEIQKELNTLEEAENLQFNDFKLINYRHHSAISASMIA